MENYNDFFEKEPAYTSVRFIGEIEKKLMQFHKSNYVD